MSSALTKTEAFKTTLKNNPVNTGLMLIITMVMEFAPQYFFWFFTLLGGHIVFDRVMKYKEGPEDTLAEAAKMQNDVVKLQENLRAKVIIKKLDVAVKDADVLRLGMFNKFADEDLETYNTEMKKVNTRIDELSTNDIELPYNDFMLENDKKFSDEGVPSTQSVKKKFSTVKVATGE